MATALARSFLTRQFGLFVAVGATAAVLHWLARYGLSHWLPFWLAVVLAYGVGMAVAFALNRAYVFPGSPRPLERQVRDFVLINLAFFPVVWAVSMGLAVYVLPWLGVPRWREEIAHAIAIGIPVVATFLLHKFITFKEDPA
jgi:putative flippase GtrA